MVSRECRKSPLTVAGCSAFIRHVCSTSHSFAPLVNLSQQQRKGGIRTRLFSPGPRNAVCSFRAGSLCHSVERPILWRAVPHRADGFVCMRRRRGYRLRARCSSTQPFEFTHFVFVVRGTYITEARNQDRWYGPGTLIYNPMGTTHRDRFHNGCGRFLTITPSADIARLADAGVPVSLVIHDPEPIAAAARIHRQIFDVHDGRLPRELIEGCCLGLAGGISPLSETDSRYVPSWLVKARQIMRDCCTTGITVRAVANCLGIHLVHLARAFRREFHISPSEYVSKCRISRARELLINSKLVLAEIAIEAGFSDQSHLTTAFRRETAMTPAAYRRLYGA